MHSTNVNDVVKQAAATTKHAAASTAHTLSHLIGEAQERIEDAHLPAVLPLRRKRRSRRPFLLGALLMVVAMTVVAARRRAAGKERAKELGTDAAARGGTDPGWTPPVTTTTDARPGSESLHSVG